MDLVQSDIEKLRQAVNAGEITLTDLHAQLGGEPSERSADDIEAMELQAVIRASGVLEECDVGVRIRVLRIFLAIHDGDPSAVTVLDAHESFSGLGFSSLETEHLAGSIAAFHQGRSELRLASREREA